MPIRVRINEVEVRAEAGESLLQVARRNGFAIPSLCYHEALASIGACRVCLVEVRGARGVELTTSCNLGVEEGLEVQTESGEIRRQRAMNLELLLARAPGSAELRQLAGEYGVSKPRFTGGQAEGGIANCILCELCVRVCDALGHHALAAVGRGDRKRIASPFDRQGEGCVGCGTCGWICPTRAISMEEAAVARLKDRWGDVRPCRYALMGLLPGTLCENDYRCACCEVDQRMIDRAGGRHPALLLLESTEGRP